MFFSSPRGSTTTTSVFDDPSVIMSKIEVVNSTNPVVLTMDSPFLDIYDWTDAQIDFADPKITDPSKRAFLKIHFRSPGLNDPEQLIYPTVAAYGTPRLDEYRSPGEKLMYIKVLFRPSDGGKFLREGNRVDPLKLIISRAKLQVAAMHDGSGESHELVYESELVDAIIDLRLFRVSIHASG